MYKADLDSPESWRIALHRPTNPAQFHSLHIPPMPRSRHFNENHFEIRPSPVPGAGMGLFSLAHILPNDTLGYYTGRVITDKQADCKPYIDSLYLLYICKDHWVYGEGAEANYTRFINHDGESPNAELIVSTRWKTARFNALREILPGEEIFFDYGPDYWDALGVTPNRVIRAA